MRSLWIAYLAILASVFSPSISFAKFDKTSEGPNEDTGWAGGISEAETKQLDADVQKQVEQFKKGRESSGIGGRGRYSGSLEMHDDFTGVTYHPDAGSGLEKPMDQVATKGKNGSEAERQKALEENRGNAGRCKDGMVTGSDGSKYACKNLSPILVDKGPAHPKDAQSAEYDDHRIYELTKEAKEAAGKAGTGYAEQVIQDATDPTLKQEVQQEYSQRGISSSTSMNSRGRITRTTRANGKTNTSEVGAEVDLLRSEYAWLEDQKRQYTDRAWKSIRAARLAGIPTNRQYEPGTRNDMTEFISLVSNDPGNDDAIAQRILERKELGLTQFCMDASGKLIVKTPQSAPNCFTPPAAASGAPSSTDPSGLSAAELAYKQKLQDLAKSNNRTLSDNDANMLAKQMASGSVSLSDANKLTDAQGTQQLYGEARANRGNLSPDQQKQMQKDIAKVKACLQRDTWCPSNDVTLQNGKQLKAFEAANDSAADFSPDVREFMYVRYRGALDGPLADMKNAMTFDDFRASTDAATGSTIYGDFVKEWEKAMQAAAKVEKVNADYEKNGMAYGADGVKKIKYKNNFKKDKFDPKKMNTTQLFGRDPNRDATSLAGTGRGNAGYKGSIYGGKGGARGRPSRPQAPMRPQPIQPPRAPTGPLVSGTDLPAI
jgi:hypothetical protein